MPARISRAADGSIEAVGSSSRRSRGPVQHRLGEREPGLFARRQHPRFGPAIAREIVAPEQLLDPLAQMLDAIEQTEHAQILLDGEIARQRRVDRGEVRAGEGRRCGRSPDRRPR